MVPKVTFPFIQLNVQENPAHLQSCYFECVEDDTEPKLMSKKQLCFREPVHCSVEDDTEPKTM